MNAKVIAFLNNKGGVGKTSLVYHVAWMLADLGKTVLTVDLDPQSNLSALLLDDEELELLWFGEGQQSTIYDCVSPLIRGTGDIASPKLQRIADGFFHLAGDLRLTDFEDHLSAEWPKCLDRQERSFRVISSFWRIIQNAAKQKDSDVVLVDLGPNLGAINRAAMVSTDYVVVPLAPDLFSIQGLTNLGPTLRRWRDEWKKRVGTDLSLDFELPEGVLQPIGYVIMQHSERLDRPLKSYNRWIARIPSEYRKSILDEPCMDVNITASEDENCIALVKHYRSLIPMSHEARKPIFHLKSADGAIGAHHQSAQNARREFENLTTRIVEKTTISLALKD